MNFLLSIEYVGACIQMNVKSEFRENFRLHCMCFLKLCWLECVIMVVCYLSCIEHINHLSTIWRYVIFKSSVPVKVTSLNVTGAVQNEKYFLLLLDKER